MRRKMKATLFLTLSAMITLWLVSPAFSQEKLSDTMQILKQKLKADKKLVIAANMQLTESESKGFWPVYDEYQKDLDALNVKINKLLASYAKAYNTDTTDEKAKELIDDMVAINQAEGGLQAAYVPKLSKALPLNKVARYLQIERKIRAIGMYELAEQVPLVP
jgi:hypothetical protein